MAATCWGLSMESCGTDRFPRSAGARELHQSCDHGGVKGNFERDLTAQDRLRFFGELRALRPACSNELIQQRNGQRQDRNNKEVSGQVSYQHTFSSNLLGTVQARVENVQAALVSNPLSTPMEVFQDRGFREGFVSGTIIAGLFQTS